MDPIRIRVARIVDFGRVIAILGTDQETSKAVVVHIDYRPWQVILESWRAARFEQPVAFDAEKLTLNLVLDPDEDGGDGEQIMAAVAA